MRPRLHPPLAIVGTACRLPGAASPDALVALARARAQALQAAPPEWPELLAWARPLYAGRVEPAPLDWRLFRMPPAHAAQLHRMERLLLQTLADALFDAGYTPEEGPGERCAIYLGATGLGVDERIDHGLRLRSGELLEVLRRTRGPDVADTHLSAVAAHLDAQCPPVASDSLTTTASISAGRLSGVFGTSGGHFAVDAGAASGLAALHLAAQALNAGHCDVAVVGALSPLVSPSTYLALEARGWLASGRLRVLDAASDGMVPAEGAVAVVLRRIGDAHREGRPVRTVLRAIAEASGPAHGVASISKLVEQASRRAMDAAGLEPDHVHHVEAQASGVVVLEDEELFGLHAAFAARHERPVTVSSASSNLGYTQAASGLVSLVRAVESVRRGMALPVAGLEVPRAAAQLRLELLREERPLEQGAVVGVSSHAWGGLAYHALVGPETQGAPVPRRPARRGEDEKLAIVGVGAIAAGAQSAASLWQNVLAKVDAIQDLAGRRFDPALYLTPLLPDGAVVPRLAGVAELPAADPKRWRLPPKVLERLDGAVLLALAAGDDALRSAGWEEDAWDKRGVRVIMGQLPLREREIELERRVLLGRFLSLAQTALERSGMSPADRRRWLADAREAALAGLLPLGSDALAWGSGMEVATRLAARHGFGGGAFSVDAACASSLVAVHAGALALLEGDADVVLAGGVAFNLLPEYYVALSALGALSARGSYPFDERADGFIPAEGAGVVVLKRLRDAQAQRDRILAVVAGLGFSSDGRGHSLFAPSPAGQARAVRRALDAAAVAPAWVDLLEAHGPGSKASDACETAAYAQVFAGRGADNPVAMGSLKSQIGHTSSAGGALSLIKTTLALSARQLPPMNGGETPNATLGLERAPIALSLEPRPWSAPSTGVRRAGVSAFGLGGSNYHLVLEEHHNTQLREPTPEPGAGSEPHPRPGRGLFADRWTIELVPLSLGERPRASLSGRHLLVLAGPAALERALVQELGARGCRVEVLRLRVGMRSEEIERLVGAHLSGTVDGVIDCSGFTEPISFRGAGHFRREMMEDAARWFAVGRALYPRLIAGGTPRPIYAAITAMGGDLGLHGHAGTVLGGATSGFLKALKHEAPGALIKSLDFDHQADVQGVAQAVIAELEDGSDRVEVGWMAGRRFVPALRRGSHADDARVVKPLDPDWVLLFSGGGRGAVFEVAKGVARMGPRVIVTGRTPVPRGDEPWLELDDAAFEDFRRAEMLRCKREEPGLTPVRFNRRFDVCVRGRELWANLREAFSLGLPLQYEVCDISNPEEVEQLTGRLRTHYGRIDGVIHGAMLEDSKSLPDKTLALLETTLDVKVVGLVNLLEATRGDPLKLVMCFGSGAGRFGNRGQTDYAAANDLMAKVVMAWDHRTPPELRCVTIDWTAWESVGAAVRTRHMVETTGVSSISPAEGVYWFVNELLLGEGQREVAIFDERLFRHWPFLGTRADGPGTPSHFDDRGLLLVPSDFPLVQRLVERTERGVVLERTFELAQDPFLRQHLLHGVPIVPGTFGVELLAEAAALACPELQLLRAQEVEIDAPLKLFHGRPVTVRLTAERIGEASGEVTVRASVESELVVQGAPRGRRTHFSGTLVLGVRPKVARGPGTLTTSLSGARAKSIYHLARDPVALGPLFCRADWVYIGHASVEGRVRAPRLRDVFRDLTSPVFQVDPLLLDTAFQVAANWDGHHLGVVSIPMGVGRIVLGRTRELDEGAHVKARPLAEDGREVFHDLEILGEDGALLMKVERLWLRRLESTSGAAGP